MPQDQDDIKGADAMKQAPTPGPLSVLAFHCESARLIASLRTEAERIGKGIPTDEPGFHKDIWTAAEIIEQAEEAFAFSQKMDVLAPTAPVEASGSEWHREGGLIYSLMQDGWRKGQPVMVNDVMIRVEACNRSETDIEPIVQAVLAALRPQPSGETREAVARIVDPGAWALHDEMLARTDARPEGVSKYTAPSLVKADDILALSPAPVASGGQHSSGEGELVPAAEYHRRGVSIINLTEHAGAHLCRAEKAEAKIAHLSGGQDVEAEADDAWSRLLDADDRTSPPEYPDHCLITKGELAGFMGDAAFIARTSAPVAETAGAAVVCWISAKGLELLAMRPEKVRALVQTLPDDDYSTPLYAAPVPAQDDDKLRTLADRVTAEVKRGADGSHVQALGALSNIEGLVLAALKAEG